MNIFECICIFWLVKCIWDMIYVWYMYTLGCPYNAVQDNMTLHISLQWLGQNTNQEFEYTKYTPYHVLSCEIWGVFCEDLEENWPRNNGIVDVQRSKFNTGALMVLRKYTLPSKTKWKPILLGRDKLEDIGFPFCCFVDHFQLRHSAYRRDMESKGP